MSLNGFWKAGGRPPEGTLTMVCRDCHSESASFDTNQNQRYSLQLQLASKSTSKSGEREWMSVSERAIDPQWYNVRKRAEEGPIDKGRPKL